MALGELRVAYSSLPGRYWTLVRAPPCRPPHTPEHIRTPEYVGGPHPWNRPVLLPDLLIADLLPNLSCPVAQTVGPPWVHCCIGSGCNDTDELTVEPLLDYIRVGARLKLVT